MHKNDNNITTTEFDSSAIARLRDGDFAAFEQLFQLYYKPLLYFACRFVRDHQAAQDIVQEVFLQVWCKRQNLEPNLNIKTYLFTAVKNRSLKHLRHQKVKERYRTEQILLDRENLSPEDLVKNRELQESIEKAVQTLPEKCRLIFCMNRFDRLKYGEIAAILDISIKTVETQMGRSYKRLRNQLHHLLLLLL